MRLCGVANLIHHFHSGVHRGIKTDCIFSRRNIVIDSAGNANAGNTAKRKVSRAAVGTVAADYHNTLDTVLFAVIDSLLHTLFCFKARASCCVKHSASAVNYVRYRTYVQIDNISLDKSVISAADTLYLHT